MGNCQAVDAAVLDIQHPSGKIERLYCPVSVSEVMRTNPGHYVSLIIPLPESGDQENVKPAQFTRVKLLRQCNTLALEVMKALQAKKCARLKGQQQPESAGKNKSQLLVAQEKKRSAYCETKKKSSMEKDYRVPKHERHRHRMPSINSASLRSKSWRPSLQSISEAGS
ncbi:hypothetical protein OIU79_006777 [Salix purpurea]|uniref:Uncharacterized protein n=1 Tax=Salix purpurea TaxID=77065 RepID=A0A9Q0TWB1_SALPP|nr:hypothetical protein OIU79_006777 [Salix purpurea]